MEDHKKNAQKWLEYLRSGPGTDSYDTVLRWLREAVQKGHFTLEDIGTSEDELMQLMALARQ